MAPWSVEVMYLKAFCAGRIRRAGCREMERLRLDEGASYPDSRVTASLATPGHDNTCRLLMHDKETWDHSVPVLHASVV